MTPTRPVRTLLFSTLYPSSVRPGHGIFVETRLRELLKSGQIDTKVVAPVPWFVSASPRFGDYARVAKTPRRETYNGHVDCHCGPVVCHCGPDPQSMTSGFMDPGS